MDALVLLGSFFVLMIIGVPVAYALGLAALIGALWIDIPLDAVMIQLASRGQQVLAAGDSVLRAGRRDHGRGRHGAAPGRVRRRAGRLHPRRAVAGQHPGLAPSSARSRARRWPTPRRIGSVLIPEMEKQRLPARLRDRGHRQRLGAGDPDPAQPQRGDLLAGRRRHGAHRGAVHGRRGCRGCCWG